MNDLARTIHREGEILFDTRLEDVQTRILLILHNNTVYKLTMHLGEYIEVYCYGKN